MGRYAHEVAPGAFAKSKTGLRIFNKKEIIELKPDQVEYELNSKLLLERRQLIGFTVRVPATTDIKVSYTQKLANLSVFNSASIIVWEGETKIFEVPFSEIARVQQFNDYYPLYIGAVNLSKSSIEVWNPATIVDKDVLVLYPVYLLPTRSQK